MAVTDLLRLEFALLAHHPGVGEDVELGAYGLGEAERDGQSAAQFEGAEQRLLAAHRTRVEGAAELPATEGGFDRTEQRRAERGLALEGEGV